MGDLHKQEIAVGVGTSKLKYDLQVQLFGRHLRPLEAHLTASSPIRAGRAIAASEHAIPDKGGLPICINSRNMNTLARI